MSRRGMVAAAGMLVLAVIVAGLVALELLEALLEWLVVIRG